MNMLLKALLIFCLVVETTAQSTEDPTSAPYTTSPDTSGDTSASTIIESTTTQVEETSTNPGISMSSESPTATATQATGETFTSFITDTTVSTKDTSATTTTKATTTLGPCDSNPCIGGSTCEERYEGFACICRPGLIYDESHGCIRTKVFAGELTKKNMTFEEKMNDKMSKEFQETARLIEEDLRNVLGTIPGYVNSTVLSLSAGSVIAEVQNFFALTSSATEADVNELIKKIPDTTFEELSLCDMGTCDVKTTNCENKEGTVTCICKDGYISSTFVVDSCISCQSGKKAVNGECVDCPFGFAGFNCDDPNLMVVVVVSVVLGALLFSFIVALIVVSSRNKKESSSPQVDFSSSYGNKDLHKPTGVPRIPRANPEANWKSNNLEMTNSDSNQSLVTRDRPESKARYGEYEEFNYRSQVPPAYSGYNGRGMDNGGVQNPYFRQDDDRMRRY